MIKLGIIGLPNVGKSTLFKLLTKMNALIANYPFATIDKNSAILNLHDQRLKVLKDIYNSKKTVPVSIEFIDIAGIVKGASQGKGLGNAFLSHIQEVNAMCQVVRLFDDKNVIHVEEKFDPLNDIKIVNEELILKDLILLENHLPKLKKKCSSVKNDELKKEYNVLLKIKKILEQEKFIYFQKFSIDEKILIKKYNFLTDKRMILVINIDESQIRNYANIENYKKIHEYAKQNGWRIFVMPIKFLSEINDFDSEQEKELLTATYKNLNIFEEHFLKTVLNFLELNIFFTCGENEVHAWTFKKGLSIKENCAIIHTDFKKYFVSANVIHYKDIVDYKSVSLIKEKGLFFNVGKDYQLNDGDIIIINHAKK